MAKDIFHQQVKAALIKSGWTITHDPYLVRITDVIKLQIDLGAENAIGAERDHYQLADIGWDRGRRVFGVLIHIDIKIKFIIHFFPY